MDDVYSMGGPDAEIRVDFGDAVSSRGPGWEHTHAYEEPGSYVAVATLEEDGQIIAQSNRVPIAVAPGESVPLDVQVRLAASPQRAQVGDPVAFDVAL